MARSSHSFRRRLGLVLRIALALGLLAYVIHANRGQLRAVLRHPVDGRLFALAFGLYAGGAILAYVRWFVLVRTTGLDFRLRDAIRLGFVGQLFNIVIPGGVGGDFVRAAYLCREQGTKTRPIASAVIDRLTGLLGLFLLACLAGTLGWSRLDPAVRRLVTFAWVFAGVTTAILSLAFVPLDVGRRKRTSRTRAELAAVGLSYRERLGVIPFAVAMGGVTHSCNVLAFYAVSRALFPQVPGLVEHFLIVPLVLFSTGIPLPFGALGATEQISFTLFRLADYSGGAVAMMAFRLLQYLNAGIGVGVFLTNPGQVRALRAEAEHLDEGLAPDLAAEPPGAARLSAGLPEP